MLRITKTKELKLRKNRPTFSFELLKGMGVAICIHLILFILFRVVPLNSLDTIQPLMPIAVETDLSTQQIERLQMVITDPLPEEKLEPPSFEKLTEMPMLMIKKKPFCVNKLKIQEADFSILEHVPYTLSADLLEEEHDR